MSVARRSERFCVLYAPTLFLCCALAQETKLGICNGRIEKSEQNFCHAELLELKLSFRSKFKSWDSLSCKSRSCSFEKERKLEKLKFGLVKFEKLRELEVGYFTEHITLKVKVDKMKIKKVKLV